MCCIGPLNTLPTPVAEPCIEILADRLSEQVTVFGRRAEFQTKPLVMPAIDMDSRRLAIFNLTEHWRHSFYSLHPLWIRGTPGALLTWLCWKNAVMIAGYHFIGTSFEACGLLCKLMSSHTARALNSGSRRSHLLDFIFRAISRTPGIHPYSQLARHASGRRARVLAGNR